MNSNHIINYKSVSDRELQIINLIAFEYSTIQIARKLSISFETVKSHRKNLFSKLNVKNVAGLMRVAFENGLVNFGGGLS